MVEIEVRKSEPESQKVESVNLDVNEIIGKVKNFVDNLRGLPSGVEHMEVNIEGFNFSVSKAGKEYDLTLKLNLAFKPKAKADVAQLGCVALA